MLTVGFSADRYGEMHNVLDAALKVSPGGLLPQKRWPMGVNRSIGSGKKVVEFFSAAIPDAV